MLAEMDRRGIGTFVPSLTNPMVYWAPARFGLALAQTWNDASSALHRAHPGRFVGTIQLPMQVPGLTDHERKLISIDNATRRPKL